MGKITIENASLTVIYNDQAYAFGYISSVTINNPIENKLACSPQGHGDGLAYQEGIGMPVSLSGVVRDVPMPLKKVLKEAHSKATRVDINLSCEVTEDEYQLNRAVIQTDISNLNLSAGESAFDVPFNALCTPNNYKAT